MEWWEILLIALGGVIFLGIIIYIFIRRRRKRTSRIKTENKNSLGTNRSQGAAVSLMIKQQGKIMRNSLEEQKELAYRLGEQLRDKNIEPSPKVLEHMKSNWELSAQYIAGQRGLPYQTNSENY